MKSIALIAAVLTAQLTLNLHAANTLTDAEKAEARQADERAGAMLDRTEGLTAEQIMRLHGVVRGVPTREER